MSRLKVIAFLIIGTAMVLIACQPAATPFPEQEFAATVAPAETEASVAIEPPAETEAPVATEPPLPAATVASRPLPPITPKNESLPANIIELTRENWSEEVDHSSLPVLIFFRERSNEYALAMIPALEEISNEYADRVKVVAINYDDYPDIGSMFGIEQVPTLIFMINEQEQARMEITATKEEIAQMIDQAIAMHPPIPLIDAEIPDDMLQLTYDNWYEEVHQSPLPVLLFFWEPGNRYALFNIPFIKEIANEYADRVKVMAINYAEYGDIGPKFSIEQIPTVMLINQGIEIARDEIPTSKEGITQMLDLYLP